jgi:hypothetical protein
VGRRRKTDRAWLAKVSPLTYTVSVGAFRARRIGLALLVGLNLSLICQGHLVGGQQVHPHVTLLDVLNPHVETSEDGHAESPVSDDTHSRVSPTQGVNMLTLAFGPGAPAEASGLSLLALATLLLLSRRMALQSLELAPWHNFNSQYDLQPEPPPPRPATASCFQVVLIRH